MRNPTGRGILFSRKVFHFLLKAYPKAHRQSYGAEMEQVFRDQCHDAWQEECGWGLFKLWLRILPDLIKTSVIEHVETMKGEKSMLEKTNTLAQGSRSTAVFMKVFAVVFVLAVTTSILITHLLPDYFAGTARMKIVPRIAPERNDPSFIQTEIEVIQSELILGTVVEKLKLNDLWGKKWNGGMAPLETGQSIELLRKSQRLVSVRDSLIEIEVFRDQPKEAATIANCIVDTYQEYRNKGLNNLPAPEKGPQVLITDKATPINIPVAPKKALNVAIGIFSGIVLGAVAGGLAILLRAALQRNRKVAV